MSDRVFLDTNIFIYSHDKEDAAKRKTARNLIFTTYLKGAAVISAQVMAEFFRVYTEKMEFPYAVAIKELHFMSQCRVIEQNIALVISAASLYSRYSLSFWDAMIVAAAVESSAEILYSEDLQSGQEIEGVRVMDPFLKI